MKLSYGRGYDTYKTFEIKKEHKKRKKCKNGIGGGRKPSHSSANLRKQHFPFRFFLILRCTLSISKSLTLVDCMRRNLVFPRTSMKPNPTTREFLNAKCMTRKKFLMIMWRHHCLILFFTKRIKMLSRRDDLMLYGILGVQFFSNSRVFFQTLKSMQN